MAEWQDNRLEASCAVTSGICRQNMAKVKSLESEFAREYVLPVERILGERTLNVVRSFTIAKAAILKKSDDPAQFWLAESRRLTPWRTLRKSQRSELSAILLDPDSYWNGRPIYRRFPPNPGFVIQLKRSSVKLDLLIDLNNHGWKWLCCDEKYWGFNFAGRSLGRMAKSIFPEFASNNSSSVWKQGTIKSLERRT